MQMIQDVAMLVKSVSGPEVFNDDRNEVIAKLNQLLVAFGVGKGYFTPNDQQFVPYNEKNIFYRFKGVVYNRLCRNSDSDGIVVLWLEVPISQVNTDDMKAKIAAQLNSIFGPNSGVNTIVENVKAVDQTSSEVIIRAYEQTKGRVSAITLFKFLNQNDKLNALKNTLRCKRVFPLVELSKADRDKFLNTPPEGFDPNLWRQGVRSNPDPERFLPHPIYGFKSLGARRQMQEVSNAVQTAVLNERVERLKTVESDLSRYKSYLQNNKRQGRELFHRFLRVAIHISQDLRQGYGLNKIEDNILGLAERASVNLVGPDALKDRINDVLQLIESDRQQIEKYFKGIDATLSKDEQLFLKQQLTVAQTRLESITELLTNGRKVLDIVERQR
jgi:nuclear pore complex protein Nup54